jgi:predicted lipoprotein with Yx(FWY)xxD motif
MFNVPNRTWSPSRIGLVLAAPALLAAACGGSSGSYSAQGGTSSGSAAPSSQAAQVKTHSGDLGTFVTDGSGRTLYLFAADHGGKSACTGGCASVWPPFTSKGAATTAGQVKASMLGTTSRGDGSEQVTYAGHPLYYFAGDHAAGDTKGQGVDEFSALWWVVSPSGSAIKHSADGAGSPKSSGGSSGGGYGGY